MITMDKETQSRLAVHHLRLCANQGEPPPFELVNWIAVLMMGVVTEATAEAPQEPQEPQQQEERQERQPGPLDLPATPAKDLAFMRRGEKP